MPTYFTTAVARVVVHLSQFTPFRGRGNWDSVAKKGFSDVSEEELNIDKAETERRDFDSFFLHFPDYDVRGAIGGKRVLDFGSGYGGRTVEYKRLCGANQVSGCEPVERHNDTGRRLASKLELEGVEFRLCNDFTIPYPNESFDIVLSYDVMEHVLDPRATMKEIYRVLRPGGMVFIVFPPYDNLSAHHLDYITTLPGLHWLFAPDTLIAAINGILSKPNGYKFRTPLQPPAKLSYRGDVKVLPTLNGLRAEEFRRLCEGFEIISLQRRPRGSGTLGPRHLLVKLIGAIMHLSDRMADRFCISVAVVLRKKNSIRHS